MKNNFKPLGSVLHDIVQKHNLENDYNLHRLEQEWDKILDDRISKIAKPYRLQGKILTVKVEEKEWRTEIKNYAQEIIEKINSNMQDLNIEGLNII